MTQRDGMGREVGGVFRIGNMCTGDGQGGLACCDSWGRKESDTTERLISSDLICTPIGGFMLMYGKTNTIL